MIKLEKKDITFTDEQWGYDEVKQGLDKLFLDEGNFLNIPVITEDTYVHQGIEIPAFITDCAVEGVEAVLFPFTNDEPFVEDGVMKNCYWFYSIINNGEKVKERNGIGTSSEDFIKDYIKIIESDNFIDEE